MQRATLPPSWLSPWPGVVVYGPPDVKALEYYRALARQRARQRSRLTIYTYGHDDVLRLGGWDGASPTSRPAPGWERLPAVSPYDHYPLHQLAAASDLHRLSGVQRVNVEWVPGVPGAGAGAGAAAGGLPSSSALRAWVVGSAIIVLLIAVVRALEKCLDVDLFKSIRRSQEWPTPTVRATSQTATEDTMRVPGQEGAEPLSTEFYDVITDFSDVTIDLPPPYSECTGAGPDRHKPPENLLYEDPPPAYSHVQFSNKNGVPSVVIVSRRRTPVPDRCDMTRAENGNNDQTTADQNTENLNIEITNGSAAAGNLESTDTSSNGETKIANTNDSNAVNSCTSTCETTVDMGEDENTLKNEVVIV